MLVVLAFFGLVWLYVREFAFLFNTIGAKRLVIGSMLVAAAVAFGCLWRWRERFTPWERHTPEVLFILIFSVLFAPLFGSLINRALAKTENQSFEFISETPYFSSNYGILKSEKLRPTGWYLNAQENGRQHTFKYTNQAYYPLTKPGDTILLPVRKGLFGCRVVLLK
ncbi:MAG: hypothetical protein OHK0019_07600 [Saprospiraceae bacterium]